jgi:predicted ATP-grasp superfamily ATP-dependent carboligase
VSDGARIPAVLLGGAVNALSVARSLWRAGVAVDVLADGRSNAIAPHSRACRRYVRPSDTSAFAEEWMTWLQNESSPAVLLPCSDEGVEFIARRRASLEAMGHLPVEADGEALLAMLDKARAYELARALGVPAPRTVTVTALADLGELDFPYPCGIKPVHSHRFARDFSADAKGVTVSSLDHARRILEPILEAGHPMLVTEYVPGPDDQYRSYYTYLDHDGEPLAHFTKRKLRQYPTHFGLGSYHLTEWSPEVAELGLRFARGVGLRGLVNVEFKRDGRDGLLKLIECNPRFTAANEQVRAAGIDFALIAYNTRVGSPIPAAKSFRDGLGLWLVVDDVRAFRDYRERGELTTRAWLKTLIHRQAPLMFSWSDPKPSLMVWLARARAFVRKPFRRSEAHRLRSAPVDPFAVAG